jgi:hypothetical protein
LGKYGSADGAACYRKSGGSGPCRRLCPATVCFLAWIGNILIFSHVEQ